MAPSIITCPRREWGVSGWFISEYIIRFRFYVDDLSGVTDKWLWRQNAAAIRREIRAWIRHTGWHAIRILLILLIDGALAASRFDRLDIYSSRDHSFSFHERRRRWRHVSSPSILRDLVRSSRKSVREENGSFLVSLSRRIFFLNLYPLILFYAIFRPLFISQTQSYVIYLFFFFLEIIYRKLLFLEHLMKRYLAYRIMFDGISYVQQCIL